ncbi:thrombopoietin receptor isoform X2 [Larus michahellis]|uniref:thrombopoietin receptor isoform X2 n=1 Tax=Larus michahellis TaxID=119627 RepID=UPI003D9BA11F
MGRGEPPARLPELHSHHFPDKGITRRSCCSSQGGRKRRHRGCSMAACLQRGWLPSLLPAILLSLHSPPSAPEPVTSQDAALLAGVPEDILCFSHSFEDLTCFWDEEEEAAESGMCQFSYWYSRDVPTVCTVSTWRHGTGGTRHVCVFPSQDVQLFTQLHLRVLDTTTNQTKYWREISVDAVGESLPSGNTPVAPGQSLDLGALPSCPPWGLAALCALQDQGVTRWGLLQEGKEPGTFPAGLIDPPWNITAHWAGAAGQLYVSWQPPLADYPNFFLYEVRCCPASSPEMSCSTTLDPSGQHLADPSAHPEVSTHAPMAGAAAASPGVGQGLIQANTWVVLQDLQPGVRYHIQVRSKPDGTSMDGVWGPWSQAVAAETPRSSGDIGLCCSTPDLQHVRCKWIWDPTEPHSSHQLFYRPPLSGAGTREDAWQQCEEVSVGAQGTHTCTFQPRAGSAISVLVNITRPHALPTLSYFKESFWLHQAVLTDAPQLVQAMVSQGQLSLEWLPPLEALAEQLDYQVRYAVENSHDWKVLQVPQASRKEVLDLRPGARYHAQVRAQPSGPWYRGSWSAWSEPVMVDITDDAGWIIPSVTVVPLLFTGVLLGLRCTFPSLYSNVKQKLWPPVPDLHRALGSFLHESSKHGQVRGPGLGPPLPSLSRRQLQGQPPPRPLCHPLGQQLLQAAAGGGGRPALPAGGAARPAGGGGPAAPAAGASCRPAVRHRHRQPVLPAHERLGPARAALSRSPSPPCPEINETRNHPASPLLRGVPVPVPQRSRAAMPTPPR